MLYGSVCMMLRDGSNGVCVFNLPKRGCVGWGVFGLDGEEFLSGFGGSLKGDFLFFLFKIDFIFGGDFGEVVCLSLLCFVSRSFSSVNGNWICFVVLCLLFDCVLVFGVKVVACWV
jgi:hypothetical protein